MLSHIAIIRSTCNLDKSYTNICTQGVSVDVVLKKTKTELIE